MCIFYRQFNNTHLLYRFFEIEIYFKLKKIDNIKLNCIE